jgi:hypothetical protein
VLFTFYMMFRSVFMKLMETWVLRILPCEFCLLCFFNLIVFGLLRAFCFVNLVEIYSFFYIFLLSFGSFSVCLVGYGYLV